MSSVLACEGVFPPLSVPQSSVPWVHLIPYSVSTFPMLFDVVSSLHLLVQKLFCQSLGHFLAYLQ